MEIRTKAAPPHAQESNGKDKRQSCTCMYRVDMDCRTKDDAMIAQYELYCRGS